MHTDTHTHTHKHTPTNNNERTAGKKDVAALLLCNVLIRHDTRTKIIVLGSPILAPPIKSRDPADKPGKELRGRVRNNEVAPRGTVAPAKHARTEPCPQRGVRKEISWLFTRLARAG